MNNLYKNTYSPKNALLSTSSFTFKMLISFAGCLVLSALLLFTILHFSNTGEANSYQKALTYGSLLLIAIVGWVVSTLLWLRSSFVKSLRTWRKYVSELSSGNLPGHLNEPFTELKGLSQQLNQLQDQLSKIKSFAANVGKGNYENSVRVFDDQGELGTALAKMRENLIKVSEEDKIRNWTNEGLARFGELLRHHSTDLKDLSEQVVSNLVKYIGANQAGIFIQHDDTASEPTLELMACYAYDRKKYIQKTIIPGEGILGQCWLEAETIYMTNIPQDYVNITSGLGGANPGCILIVPLKINEIVVGVIEIAAFKPFAPHVISLVEKICESIAATIATAKTNEKTKLLLEEAQVMAEQMRAQEEEMRQNMEELSATQEELDRKFKESRDQSAKMEAVLITAPNAILTTDDRGFIESINPKGEAMFGMSAVHLTGKHISSILEGMANEQDFSRLASDAAYEAKILGKSLEMNGINLKTNTVFASESIFNKAYLGDRKIYTGIVRDITEIKQTEQEIKDSMEALRKTQEDMQQAQALLIEKEGNLDALINNTEDTIVAIDRNYYITVVNDALKKRFALSGKVLNVGTYVFDILPEGTHENWKTWYDRALSGERFKRTDRRQVGDTEIFIEVDHNPIRDKEGNVIGVSVFSRNITEAVVEKQRYEDRIRELEAQLKA